MNQYNPNHHHRRSIRLRGYDYSQQGAYFVTIVTQNRINLFGHVVDGEMILNDAGKMIEKWYFELMNKFPDIQCDQYIIMPNHIHFIIINVGADLRVCPDDMGEHIGSPLRVFPDDMGEHVGSPQRWETGEHGNMGEHVGSPLHKIVQWFKTMTTN
ncbi:MAG: hypothetical protein ACPLKS_07705, partial [Caldisericum exile]